MRNKLAKEQKVCSSCGGRIMPKNKYTYKCSDCGQEYYISADRTHKVNISISVRKVIIIIAAALMAVTAIGVVGYEFYTGMLVRHAGRFSSGFQEFVTEVYQKPVAKITEEDLEKIKYLRIEENPNYLFTYSFEDYYDYSGWESYEPTLKTVEVDFMNKEILPSDLEYFPGLTRVELYTEAWESYTLSEENKLRHISCLDGLSRYGKGEFFTLLNPDTIEEVIIWGAGKRKDFSFLSDLEQVKRFTLKDANIKSASVFANMKQLESLTLEDAVMKEDEVYDIVKELLTLPSLKSLTITGNSIWYISDEQWKELQEMYAGKIKMERE